MNNNFGTRFRKAPVLEATIELAKARLAYKLDRYDRALFMDADTYVCKPLTGAVCGVGGGYDVAFVPVAFTVRIASYPA